MKCASCGDKEQTESFCTNCGAPMMQNSDTVSQLPSKKRKRYISIAVFASAILLLCLLGLYWGRASILQTVSSGLPYGSYRALLAKCPGSGIDIYWTPLEVNFSQGQNLSSGAMVTYERINYKIDFDIRGDWFASFKIADNGLGTKDVLGCGG